MMRRLIPLVIGMCLTGCAVSTATPVRVSADYGQSTRNMVAQSVYDINKTEKPERWAPDGMRGQKAAVVLQKGYQSDYGSPSRVRSPAQINGAGGFGSGGGAAGMGGGITSQ